MQTAEITSFLRTIAILVIVYYGVKIIAKYVGPIILKRAATKFEERVRQQQQQQAGYTENSKVGETVIDKKPRTQKTSSDSVGEYVDYEEVD